jgi:hypothetical protein
MTPCTSRDHRLRWRPAALAAAALLASQAASSAHAFAFDTGTPDVTLRWDNTLKYSNGYRLEKRSPTLLADANGDDGDRNFARGWVSQRFDLLSELDLAVQRRFGARVSAAGWYDAVYQRRNDNDSPMTLNRLDASVPSNEFTRGTRGVHGRNFEFLDAFVYGNFASGNLRLGRYALLYGETLFFGANGIANAQAPVDVVKLLTVPSAQFKEIVIPVNQVSGQYQLLPNLAIGAYYQLEWRKSRVPASGSYLSSSDVFDAGADSFLAAPGVLFPRVADQRAPDHGQGGVQLRWTPSGTDVELGFYAARYHEKVFAPVLYPLLGRYQLVYPRGIQTYGASFSTEIGGANVAGEVSVRRNAPLVGGAVVALSPAVAAPGEPFHPVGSTAHVNLSGIFLLGKKAAWDNATLTAEAGWNRATSVKLNPAQVDTTTTRDAWGMRLIFTPEYYQVLPQLDVSVPLGLGFNPQGRSRAVANFNGGVHRGGDLSLGLQATYQQVWKLGMQWVHYLGSAGTTFDAAAQLSFKQTLADRDVLAFSVQRTF